MQKFVKKNSLQLFTQAFGNEQNPACILIAGAMAPSIFWTDSFCENLAKRSFFVIRYDHRDIGLSTQIDWNSHRYDLKELADDAITIMKDYGFKNAYFVGHSMGGYICQKLALIYTDLIKAQVIISAGSLVGDKTPLTPEEKKTLDKTWEIFLNRKDSQVEGFLEVFKYLNGDIPFDRELATDYIKYLIDHSPNSLVPGNNHELVMRNITQETLPSIKIPTSIIHGEKDPLVLPKEARALNAAIPSSHLHLIPRMGHMIFNRSLENQIVNLISTFLNQLK